MCVCVSGVMLLTLFGKVRLATVGASCVCVCVWGPDSPGVVPPPPDPSPCDSTTTSLAAADPKAARRRRSARTERRTEETTPGQNRLQGKPQGQLHRAPWGSRPVGEHPAFRKDGVERSKAAFERGDVQFSKNGLACVHRWSDPGISIIGSEP